MEAEGLGMIPLGSQEGLVRRIRDLNTIPDIFLYYKALVPSSTAPLEVQGK